MCVTKLCNNLFFFPFFIFLKHVSIVYIKFYIYIFCRTFWKPISQKWYSGGKHKSHWWKANYNRLIIPVNKLRHTYEIALDHTSWVFFSLTHIPTRKYETYTYQVQHISYRVRTHKTVSTVYTRKTRYFIFELLCTKNSLMIYRCYTYSLFSFLPFLSKSGFYANV